MQHIPGNKELEGDETGEKVTGEKERVDNRKSKKNLGRRK